MDFSAVLQRIDCLFEEVNARYAVVGGLAMASYGLVRTTLDLDLVADASHQDALVAGMEALGYETVHRSRGYSNHVHSDPASGHVDFVYVDGETADRIFAEVRRVGGPRGELIPVPSPEHLAAMKVRAMRNDPGRTFQEQSDIRYLIRSAGADREEIRRQYARHGLEAKFAELLEAL